MSPTTTPARRASRGRHRPGATVEAIVLKDKITECVDEIDCRRPPHLEIRLRDIKGRVNKQIDISNSTRAADLSPLMQTDLRALRDFEAESRTQISLTAFP